MPPPDGNIVFSANSLQTFVDCERRFELNYVRGLKWPAVEAEPVLNSETHLENGRRFHEMIQRQLLDIPVPEPDAARDPELAAWWNQFLIHPPDIEEGERHPEKILVGTLEGRLLMAAYDLIVITPDHRALIYDWKTWRQPRSLHQVETLLQSRVYPYLLVKEGQALTPGHAPIAPDRIELRYWYVNFPDQSPAFNYSEARYRADKAYLDTLMTRIETTGAGDFALTPDTRRCLYCPYRSYCRRGEQAGPFEEMDMDDPDFSTSFLGDIDDYESIAF